MWKSTIRESGAPSATTNGTVAKPPSCAENWDSSEPFVKRTTHCMDPPDVSSMPDRIASLVPCYFVGMIAFLILPVSCYTRINLNYVIVIKFSYSRVLWPSSWMALSTSATCEDCKSARIDSITMLAFHWFSFAIQSSEHKNKPISFRSIYFCSFLTLSLRSRSQIWLTSNSLYSSGTHQHTFHGKIHHLEPVH